MSTVSQITVTDVSQISVVTAGTQGVAGPNTILGRSVAESTASTAGSLLVYDHSNTQWVDSQSSAAQSLNAKLFNLGFTSGGAVVTGVLDEDNMGSNSNVKLATQQSIKSYVDVQNAAQAVSFQGDTGGNQSVTINTEVLNIAGGTGLDTVGSSNTLTINIDSTVATLTGSQTLTNKTLTAPVLNTVDINGGDISTGTVINKSPTITLAGDLSGNATLSQLGNATLTATIVANSVALGTDTTGNYVATLAASNAGIDVANSGAETAGVTIGLNTEYVQDLVGAMVSSNTENGITVTYQDADGTIDFDVADPVITLSGDVAGSATMTNLGDVTISTTIQANSVALGTDTTGNYIATVAAGEGIDVSGSGSESAGITISAEDATDSNKGIASFDSTDFSVSSGAVTLQAERVQDIVGAMVSSNTESGIAVAYQDADGTLDFNADDFTIALSGDLSGSVTITDLASATLTATIVNNAVALGTDTTGNYVATITAGEGIDVSGSGSETAGVTITAEDATDSNKGIASFDSTDFTVSSGDVTLNSERVQDIVGAMVSSNTESGIAVTYEDGDGTLDFNVADPTITIAGDVDGSATMTNLGNTTITVALDTVNSNVGSFGTATAIPAITVNAKGLVTAVSTNAIATNFTLAADSGSNDTFNTGETLTFSGTTNEVTTAVSNNEITIGLPDDVTIGGALTVTGNFTVNGTTTTLNTATLDVEDLTIRVGKNATTLSATNGAGIEFGASSGKPTITWDNSNSRLTSNKTFHAASLVGALTGNASTATTLETTRAIALSGDVVGTANFDGSAGISISTTIQANSVALGTDTTGNYIATIAGTSNEVEVSGSGSETASVTIGLPSATEITTSLGVGGGSTNGVVIEQGAIKIKNGGTQSFIDFYCESNNAHYLRLQAPAHSAFSGNPTVTLPATAGTLVGSGDSGTVSNTMLANSSVNFGGVSLALGASDTTPAFNLQDATGYPTSSLTGTITNAQLAGSIANAKLSNSSVSFGGVSVALGASDATPAFDLSDATNYPTSSLSGTITNAQLAGSIANSKLANSAITVSDGSNSTATALGGTITFAAGEGLDVSESSGTVTFSAEDATASNKGVASFTSEFSVSSGAVSIANTGVSAGSYGTATAIPAITVNAKGQVTAVSTNNISTSFTLAADSGSNDTFATGETLTISGTSNEIETAVSNNEITIGLPNAVTVTTLSTTNLNINSTAVSSTAAELNILDGATITTAELNLLDGGTSATSTTLANADRVIVNDAGTMKQVALSDLAVYMGDNVTINQTQTALTVSGNGSFGGTLTVTGATALNGGLTMDTDKFVVANTTGNTSIGGTLGVTGLSTLASLAVTNDVTVNTNVFKVDTSNNRVGVKTASPSVSLDVGSATDAMIVPKGTTAQRPSGAAGQFRFNTSLNRFEGHDGTSFGEIGGGGSNTFTVDNFTTANSSTTAFTLSQTPNSEDNLLVFVGGVFQNPNDYVLNGTTLTLDEAPPSATRIIVYSVRAAVSGSNLNNDQFTCNGSTTAFTLSIAPVDENNTQVFLDGVYQQKTDYSVSGTTLTMDTAPANGAILEVNTFTQTDINVPVNDTIKASHLNTDIISGLTEVTAVSGDKLMILDATDSALKKTDVNTLMATAVSISSSADAVALTFDSNENAAFGGTVTANAGVVVDTITIDGSTVSASGGLTLDVAGDIQLNADGGDITFNDGATHIGSLSNSSSDFVIESKVSDKDLIFKGNDGGSTITALTLDMSASGAATFNAGANFSGNVDISVGSNLNSEIKQLSFDNFPNEGIGITFSRTSSDADLMAIGVADTSLLNIASRSGLIFSTGGGTTYSATSESMRIDSSGNVGIGSSSITTISSGATTVDIKGTVTTKGGAIKLRSSDASVDTHLYADNTNGLAIHTTTSHPIVFRTAGSERMRIDSSGRLLVNLTSNDNGAFIQTKDAGSGCYGWTEGTSAVDARIFANTSQGAVIATQSAHPLALQTNGQERMRIDSSGNVGIGTTPASASSTTRMHIHNGTSTAILQLTGAGVGTTDSDGTELAADDNGDFRIRNFESGSMQFFNNGSERMRITNQGNLLKNTTYDGFGAAQVIYATGTNPQATNLTLWSGGGSGIKFVQFVNSSGVQCGSITQNGTSAVTYGSGSDYRLKENVKSLENGLSKVQKLNPVQFDWKESGETNEGFIAHEVQEICKEAVSGQKDGEEMQGVDYGRITPLLVKAIQEQQVIIDDLKARIETLEG